ncbi:MAG: hypothetical protein WBA22_10075 [Candidatus Methanofastidiosia archaeon]
MQDKENNIAVIFRIAARDLREEIGKDRMGLSPLRDMKEKLTAYCNCISDKEELSYEDEELLFHLFFLKYYINHIMNHIAGDASCKLDDRLLKEIANEIALGFEIYVEYLKDGKAYEGLMRMPLPYLRKIGYLRGDRNGR